MALVISKDGKYVKADWINNFTIVDEKLAQLRSDLDAGIEISDVDGLAAALSSLASSISGKQDKNALAELFPSSDLAAVNIPGTYYIPDISGMSSLPSALIGRAGSAWVEIKRYETVKKVYIDYNAGGLYSVSSTTTSETFTGEWITI
jgi:hypothetical protein